MNPEDKKVIVIGAGFSGLMTGFYLLEQGFKTSFYEKNKVEGGLIGTRETQYGFVEQAANAFISNAELERISSKIGVPLYETSDLARKRFVFNNGKLRRWPLSLQAHFRLACFILRYIFFKKTLLPTERQSLQQWGERWLGTEITNTLLSTLMRGVYASTAKELSARLILKPLFSPKKKKRGSLRGSVAPRNGMGEWTAGVKRYLENNGCEFHFGEQWKGDLSSRPVILAAGLQSAKPILNELQDSRFEVLNEVPVLSLTSLTLHIASESEGLAAGFGCLFPESEGFNALGVLNNSYIFEGRAKGCRSETWIFNDAKSPSSQLPKLDLLQLVSEDRKKMGIADFHILASYCHQWTEAIPQYGLKLELALENLNFRENNLFLVGNYLGQLGLSRILTVAEEVAKLISEKGKWEK